MWPAIQKPLARYRDLEVQLADPTVAVDHLRYSAIAREHGQLAKLIRPYLDYEQVLADIRHAEALAAEADPDMRAYAEEELAGLRRRADELKSRIEDLLLVDPGEDYDRIIMEIRAGTGGDEAALAGADLAPLGNERELALCARLGEFPEAVENAARDYAPHLIAFYLKDLAGEFHSYYNAERFLVDDAKLRDARLALCLAVRQTLRNGLRIIGVSAPESM